MPLTGAAPGDPYASQGYYGAQSAAAPLPQDPGSASLLPGYAPPGAQQQQYRPAPQAPAPAPAPAPAFPNDPYGGYDAVNYPSIPALIEHSQRGGFGGGSGGNFNNFGDARASSGGDYGGSRAARPKEEPGAPHGNARYRCILLPTRDGGDIEDVVCQVGLDGVALFPPGSSPSSGEHVYPMDRVSRWSLTDPTILTVKVVGGETDAVAVSSDAATIGAIMDTLTTSAFQWCELRGHDAASTVEERSAGSGRASEWVNHKAAAGAGGTANAGGAGASAAEAAPAVRWHEAAAHCGWLTKKGEHLSTWRRRWFVLKDGKLAWFKSNDVTAASKPRGVLDLANVASACTTTKAEAGRAHGVELIGSAEAEKAGCKFLVADSERECDAWAAALDAAINGPPTRPGVTGGANGATGGGDWSSPAAVSDDGGLASQLRRGYQSAAAASSAAAARDRDVELNVTGYVPGAPAPSSTPAYDPYGARGGAAAASAASQWETFYTDEGTPYFVNSVTGVTQWETPPGVSVAY